MPCNAELQALGLRLGAPNLKNDGVNRVENMDRPMRDAEQRWRIRFNRRDMIGYAALRDQFISMQHHKDLTTLEQLAMQCVEKVPLQSGDCIVVDNHRVLHGRSAFDPSSGRLIKRLRIMEAET